MRCWLYLWFARSDLHWLHLSLTLGAMIILNTRAASEGGLLHVPVTHRLEAWPHSCRTLSQPHAFIVGLRWQWHLPGHLVGHGLQSTLCDCCCCCSGGGGCCGCDVGISISCRHCCRCCSRSCSCYCDVFTNLLHHINTSAILNFKQGWGKTTYHYDFKDLNCSLREIWWLQSSVLY